MNRQAHELTKAVKPNAAAVEVAGRNWLTAQLLARGFEVAIPEVDRGIDLIVFQEVGAFGIRALPLQLKCSSGEAFSLDRKYAGRGIPMAYVWNVLGEPAAFLMSYDEALATLGERATETSSWSGRGYYAFNRISADLRARLEPFRNRWGWLADKLGDQPRSG